MYVQDQFFVFYNFFMCDCMCKVEYANAENQIKTILNNFDFTSFFYILFQIKMQSGNKWSTDFAQFLSIEAL